MDSTFKGFECHLQKNYLPGESIFNLMNNRALKTVKHNEARIIRPKENVILEAKRVILIEQLDKIADMTLGERHSTSDAKMCVTNENVCTTPEHILRKTSAVDVVSLRANKVQKSDIDARELDLSRKYFTMWLERLRKRKVNLDEVTQKQKIERFLSALKKQKEVQNRQNSPSEQLDDKTNNEYKSFSIDKVRQQNSECYKYRFKAQQNIIETQKAKLLEQERIIHDIQLGIIRGEIERSMNQSKVEIREIFRNCSGRVKCKIAPPLAVENDVNVIEMRCNRAPKILQQMEKRAQERALKRQMILEKKKMMDDARKKQIEEAIENKRLADEEQTRKNLQAIKEKRQKDADLDRLRQLNKKKYLDSLRKANNFYDEKLKLFGFSSFKYMIAMRVENEIRSDVFYEHNLKGRIFNVWRNYTVKKLEEDYFAAECLYKRKVCRKMLKSWCTILVIRRQSMQVAQDLYDMRLESRTFIHWHRYVCRRYMEELKLLKMSEKHYNSRIRLHYFYQWKALPAVLQLERAKEEKKKKWREKVWEVLPDYEPVVGE